MFERAAHPRVFALPPGVDFARELVGGLLGRTAGQAPEALARVTLLVNTRRTQRRLLDLLAARGPLLLPRVQLVTDLAPPVPIPPAVPPLRRRLELTGLVAALLDRQPDLAPRTALYDLTDSLADLMDEMQGEGVPPSRLASLDLSVHSAHWARSLAFIGIVARYFEADAAPDVEARHRRAVEALAAEWKRAPPADPVIVAGSTGSRGTTARLMEAVAGLPQGGAGAARLRLRHAARGLGSVCGPMRRQRTIRSTVSRGSSTGSTGRPPMWRPGPSPHPPTRHGTGSCRWRFGRRR